MCGFYQGDVPLVCFSPLSPLLIQTYTRIILKQSSYFKLAISMLIVLTLSILIYALSNLVARAKGGSVLNRTKVTNINGQKWVRSTTGRREGAVSARDQNAFWQVPTRVPLGDPGASRASDDPVSCFRFHHASDDAGYFVSGVFTERHYPLFSF